MDHKERLCTGTIWEEFERLEGILWLNHLFRSPNPALVQCAIFIGVHFGLDLGDESEDKRLTDSSHLTPLEVLEAEILASYLSNHSNEVLFSVSEFIEEVLVDFIRLSSPPQSDRD